MAKLVQHQAGDGRPVDNDLDDLTYAWGRLNDPGRRQLAIRFIRMLAEDPGGHHAGRLTLAGGTPWQVEVDA